MPIFIDIKMWAHILLREIYFLIFCNCHVLLELFFQKAEFNTNNRKQMQRPIPDHTNLPPGTISSKTKTLKFIDKLKEMHTCGKI